MSILRDIIRGSTPIDATDYQVFLQSLIEDRVQKPALIALLSALAAKPLALQDILNFVEFIERDAPKRRLPISSRAINIVGTGGGPSTFNISTTAAFVAAAAGATVLKSGSHAYNSQCGSLDLLHALGLNIPTSDQALNAMVETLNIGFVHPAMYPPLLRRIAVSVMPLNLRDIGGFINLIGPLLCPIEVKGQICGVSQHPYLDIFSTALARRGINNALTVWAEVGLDEFSAVGKNHYAVFEGDSRHHVFDPAQHGMHHGDLQALCGGTPETNQAMMMSIFSGKHTSAAADTVALNAAFILQQAGIQTDIDEAIGLARDTLQSGKALRCLHNSIEYSHDCLSLEAHT